MGSSDRDSRRGKKKGAGKGKVDASDSEGSSLLGFTPRDEFLGRQAQQKQASSSSRVSAAADRVEETGPTKSAPWARSRMLKKKSSRSGKSSAVPERAHSDPNADKADAKAAAARRSSHHDAADEKSSPGGDKKEPAEQRRSSYNADKDTIERHNREREAKDRAKQASQGIEKMVMAEQGAKGHHRQKSGNVNPIGNASDRVLASGSEHRLQSGSEHKMPGGSEHGKGPPVARHVPVGEPYAVPTKQGSPPDKHSPPGHPQGGGRGPQQHGPGGRVPPQGPPGDHRAQYRRHNSLELDYASQARTAADAREASGHGPPGRGHPGRGDGPMFVRGPKGRPTLVSSFSLG